MENFPLQQLPTKPEFSQLDSRAAVVAVRSVAAPLDIEEGELVDSDDEGALVIDESEGKCFIKMSLLSVVSGLNQFNLHTCDLSTIILVQMSGKSSRCNHCFNIVIQDIDTLAANTKHNP